MVDDQKSIQGSPGYWITRLARSMERDFENRLEPLGITRGAYAVLSAIHHEKKTRPADLAVFLGVDGAAVTRHLDRVEKQGLIKRKPSTSDRRSTDINLTSDGLQVLRRGRAGSRATNKKFNAGLTADEVDSLQSAVRTMLANAEEAVPEV